MRITIEPSQPPVPTFSSEGTSYSVVIDHPHDDLTLDLAIELCMSALKAYGYSSTSIDQWLAGD